MNDCCDYTARKNTVKGRRLLEAVDNKFETRWY